MIRDFQNRLVFAGKAVRRSAAWLALIGALLLPLAHAAPAGANHPFPFGKPLYIPPVLTSPNITLTAAQTSAQIFDGMPTSLWTYNGGLPGPTIRRPTGQTTNVTLVNNLPGTVGSLSLHNHGNHSSPENDGQPDTYLVPPGGSRTYTYTGNEIGGNERGATQWYHDHRMDVTGRNVWHGLAGFYIIDDPADPTTLPAGQFDVPLMLLDRSFDSLNQLNYVFNQNGVIGDHILANGVPQPYFDVGDRKYRVRILNAANYSSYDLELSNGDSMVQIGTESGLLPAPVSRQHILLAPGERADVVIDFNGRLGQQIVLRNTLGSGATGDVMQFRVNSDLTDSSSVPATLRPKETLGTSIVTRTFDFGKRGGQWVINGLPFDSNRIDAQPALGTTERWIFRNGGGWSHVVHMHDVDAQLISRNGLPPDPSEITKESWNIDGGQTVEVLVRFNDHTGRYVFHCHVIEHEDDRMMAQFEVVGPPQGRIKVVQDTVPDDPQDFNFNAGGGLSPASFLLDDDGNSGSDTSSTKVYDSVPAGSGYSVSQILPSGWKQQGVSCSDGSPTSNIGVSAGETVTCTFTNAPNFYPAPASASTLAVALVPAFKQCGTGGNPPTGSHAPSLGVGSCNPGPTSSLARVGSSNSGSVALNVGPSDVSIVETNSDVRTAGGADYNPQPPGTPDLTTTARMRFTDLLNCSTTGCSGPYDQPATATDLDFGPIPIECVPTGDVSSAPGSDCNTTTSANSVIAGSVVPGKQSVVQIFRIRVNDASGVLFQQQGFFSP